MSPDSAVSTFRSVLCPVDFSVHSRDALKAAVAVVRRTGATLTVLYADDPLINAAIAASYNSRLMTARTLTALRQLLAQAGVSADLARRSCTVESVVGRPGVEILKAARRHHSDLIVIGTKGLGGARKLFFGSTTEQVLRATKCAVLAVPPRPARIARRWPGPRVLGAIELGATDRQDAAAIVALARALESQLTLAHVVQPTAAPPWLAPQLRTHDRQRLAAARARLQRLAPDGVECRIVLGDPAEELPAVADDIAANLTVLRLRRGHGIFGQRQGSTTYRVLCGSTTPVLALPVR